MVPGWVLVAQAVQRQKASSIGGPLGATAAATESSSLAEDAIGAITTESGEKGRDTRVKELLRRVKELKKPFNVKALLKRNKKLT